MLLLCFTMCGSLHIWTGKAFTFYLVTQKSNPVLSSINGQEKMNFQNKTVLNYASVNSKHQHLPPRKPPGIFPNFQPGSRDLYHLNFPGANLLHNVKIPSCQLMPHEGTFQLQTDVASLCCSLVTKSV